MNIDVQEVPGWVRRYERLWSKRVLPEVAESCHGCAEGACKRTEGAVGNAQHSGTEPERYLQQGCTQCHTSGPNRTMRTAPHHWRAALRLPYRVHWWRAVCKGRHCGRGSYGLALCDPCRHRRRTKRRCAHGRGIAPGSAHHRGARGRHAPSSGKHRWRRIQYRPSDC